MRLFFGSRPGCQRGTVTLLIVGLAFAARCSSGADALADYISRSDDSFAWKKTGQRETNSLNVVRLECTSQTWRGNVWRHQLLLARPATLRNPDMAFLFITGDGDVEHQLGLLRTLAESAGAVTAAINDVPNQPLYGGLKEDDLIAYTFEQFLESGDTTWPLLFPMVKSAVKGMDCVQAEAQQDFSQKITRFVVGGASKRGWTTWLTAAEDGRVKAIAPMVIDMLNMKAQARWAQEMYGGQSEEINAYTKLHLTERMDDPRMVDLRSWVDPYSFRDRYTMPKLLLLGTDDPYWVVDSLRNYWNDLPDPKLVFQTPNAGHDLAGGREAIPVLAAYFQMIADHETLPQMTWQFTSNSIESATLDVSLSQPAQTFRLWTATATNRDFRRSKWSSAELKPFSMTKVEVKVESPANGFRAYLVEADMKTAAGRDYKLSTEARVVPDGPPKRNKEDPNDVK
jgi:PhoPQ-activated pathogenicity-related protein